MENSTTADPLDGYQRFTVELTDYEAALLQAELDTQRAFSDQMAEQRGWPSLGWNLDKMASAILGDLLRQRARQEGGAQ